MIFYANPSRHCHPSPRNEQAIVLEPLVRARGIGCSLVQQKADSPRRKPDYGVLIAFLLESEFFVVAWA